MRNVDRSWCGFDDDERRVYRFVREAREGADPCFEVGDDDGVLRRYGAEQLLRRESASRSTWFGVLDPVDYCEADAVRGVSAVTLEDVRPGVGMFSVSLVNLVA